MSALKKAQNISQMDKTVKEKLAQFNSNASSMLKTRIGDTVYLEYLALPEDTLVAGETGFVEYELLTADQRKRRDLETAQAYFILYLAMSGIKKLSIDSVFLEKATVGEGELNPADTASTMRLQKLYYDMAISFCDKYSATGDLSIIVI